MKQVRALPFGGSALCLMICTTLLPGCGLILLGTTQPIRVDSAPTQALATFDGQQMTTPADAVVRRRDAVLVLRASKSGYQPTCMIVEGRMNHLATTVDSIPAAIPLLIDAIAGSLREYPPYVQITLRSSLPFQEPTVLPSDEEVVHAWRTEHRDLCRERALYRPCAEGPSQLKRIDEATRGGSVPDIRMADPMAVLSGHPTTPEELAEKYIADCTEEIVRLSGPASAAASIVGWGPVDVQLRAMQSGLDFMKWWLDNRRERTKHPSSERIPGP